MNAAHDVDLERSSVARFDGVPSGLVFLAVRGRHGWIGGMGVTPEARGRGLGRELMRAALGTAWSSHLSSVQLEVIEENRWAIEIYESIGFLGRRRLEVWARVPGPLPSAGSLPRAAVLEPARWIETLASRPAPPRPWQRATVTLARAMPLEAYAVEEGGMPVAGVALRVDAGRASILDLAAAPGAPDGAMDSALRAALEAHPEAAFMILNLAENDPARPAVARAGFEVRFRQREMLRRRRPGG